MTKLTLMHDTANAILMINISVTLLKRELIQEKIDIQAINDRLDNMKSKLKELNLTLDTWYKEEKLKEQIVYGNKD